MIRSYKSSDKQRLIDIFILNVPEYFDIGEESNFRGYLDNDKNNYFVFVKNGLIIGGGGYHVFNDIREGHISWDMVDPNFQGEGVGKELVEHCLNLIRLKYNAGSIVVSTSQKAFQFYEKFGFKIKRVEKNHWGKGLDLYEMIIN